MQSAMRRLWRLFSTRKRVQASAEPFEDGLAAHQRGDYATALKFWRPLAEQGNANAQYRLGLIYANGRGMPQDNAEAVKWYGMAAEQGDAEAQLNLGHMYTVGRGVSEDALLAYMWFDLSAAHGEKKAKESRDTAAKRMTPAQTAEAQRMAREWMAKHPQP